MCNFIDYDVVRDIPISEIAEKWDINLHWKGNKKRATFICPNPEHNDRRLGNCLLTEQGTKNMFFCFACNKGGGGIELVCYLDDLYSKFSTYEDAKREAALRISKAFGLIKDDFVINKKPTKGLKISEYENFFGFGKALLENDIDIKDKIKSYSMKNLKKDDKEAHDYLLTLRFEQKYEHYNIIIDRIKTGYYLKYGKNFLPSDLWIETILRKQQELTLAYVKALE